MLKKALVTGILMASLTAPAVHAIGFPMTDAVNIAKDIYDNIMVVMEHGIDYAMSETKLDQMSQASEDNIDAMNSGAANYIARINQAATDIFNLQQAENMTPAPGTCSTVMFSKSLDDALCGMESEISELSNERSSYGGAYREQIVSNQSPQGIGSMSLAASGPGAEATMSAAKKAIEKHKKEITKHIKNLDRHTAEGRGIDVMRPDLSLIHDSSPHELTDDQYDIAMSRLFIEYPPYVSKNPIDPVTDEEKVLISRKVVQTEIASMVAAKDIAMKKKGSGTLPSYLRAMDMAARIRLTPEGTYDNTNTSFLQDIASGGSGEGASSREEILMYSIRLNTEMSKYKQLLAMELQLVNYGLIKMDEIHY
jgi:hypothetical protein